MGWKDIFGFGSKSRATATGPQLNLTDGPAPTIQPGMDTAQSPTPPQPAEPAPSTPTPEAAPVTDSSSLLGGEVTITSATAEDNAADTAAASSGNVADDINNSGEVKITG